MPRRHGDHDIDEPPKKRTFTLPVDNRIDIAAGEILTDISGKRWKLGKPIGLGGFGVIHEVSENESRDNNKYVVKIEAHCSGPLFTEINCYLRIAKKNMIEEWKKKKRLSSLGMPLYIASGSHTFKGDKYRFLVLPRYQKDIEWILQEKKKFNLKTVLLLSSQILDILEYIHSKGYIHSDIKAPNIMLGEMKLTKENKVSSFSKSPVKYPRIRSCRVRKLMENNMRRYDTRKICNVNYNEDHLAEEHYKEFLNSEIDLEPKRRKIKTNDSDMHQLYLIDFGLASKYKLSSGEHKNSQDERKAHAGTLLFCSRDAHKGFQSRRSDLESLAYNMVYWLTGSLPWIDDLENPEMVHRKKKHCFTDPLGFLYFCMSDPPRILKEFFQYIKKLDMQDCPDYNSCQQLIKKSLREHGYHEREKFDFDNVEGWGLVKKKVPLQVVVPMNEFKRPPLLSNMPMKPILRKENKTKKIGLNWSRMLTNPEILMKKKVRDKKSEECNEPSPVMDFDLDSLDPTPTMREVFCRYEERKGLSPKCVEEYDSSDVPQGYTPAMAALWTRMMEERALEEAVRPVRKNKKANKKARKQNNNNSRESSKTKTKSIHITTRSHSLRG